MPNLLSTSSGLPFLVHRVILDGEIVVLEAEGVAHARLAKAMKLPVSPDTLLRLLEQADALERGTPRVLGVDDLSLRRRSTYATLLMDLESHRPVDLLRGREAATLANWLKQHP